MEDETKLLDPTLTENRCDTKLSVSSLAKVWENLDGIPGKKNGKNVTINRNGEKIWNGNDRKRKFVGGGGPLATGLSGKSSLGMGGLRRNQM